MFGNTKICGNLMFENTKRHCLIPQCLLYNRFNITFQTSHYNLLLHRLSPYDSCLS